MKRTADVGLSVLLASLLACVGALPAESGDGAWRRSGIWDDGDAEFCAYEVDWFRYGHLNPGRALMIAVKEPWAPDLDVKADTARDNGFDVLKLNHIRDVPTGIYTYHQMASVFVRRDTGALQKLAATSSEGCGISTADLRGGRLRTRSYFDSQGDQDWEYPEQALPEDGLALSLREYVQGDTPETVAVFPSLMAGRFSTLEAIVYRLDRALKTVEVPAGSFEAVQLTLTASDRWLRFSFAPASPHQLLRLEQSDGTDYRLAKCERIPYWSMNQPGGEQWLPEGVR